MKVKSRSHLEKNDLAGFANLIITKIWFYDNLYVFRGWGIHFWHYYWATMFRWPRKSRSTSGTGGTWRYWWLCLMDFWNFFIIYVFEGEESISDIPIELPCFGDLENQVNFRYRRYLKVLMIVSYGFWNFFTIYVFEGEESISDIPIELPCFGDLENPGQLPVQEVLAGTDDCVSWIFEISSLFMFSRSRNPLLTFLLSYHVRVTSKSRSTSGTGGTRRYWWFCLINFRNFFSIHVFEVKKSIADIPTELPCLGDLENLGQLPVQEVLMILSYDFWNFFNIYVSEVKESIAGIPTELPVRVTSKTSRTGSWPRFLRSPKRGSSVGISAMDSLTSIT